MIFCFCFNVITPDFPLTFARVIFYQSGSVFNCYCGSLLSYHIHQAVDKAIKHYEEGYRVVVDCDLRSYFDTIHHQRIRNYLGYFISDKTVLRLIWKFLRSGILDKDIYIETTKGGPLSPILATVYLNMLDRELEKRGIVSSGMQMTVRHESKRSVLD